MFWLELKAKIEVIGSILGIIIFIATVVVLLIDNKE